MRGSNEGWCLCCTKLSKMPNAPVLFCQISGDSGWIRPDESGSWNSFISSACSSSVTLFFAIFCIIIDWWVYRATLVSKILPCRAGQTVVPASLLLLLLAVSIHVGCLVVWNFPWLGLGHAHQRSCAVAQTASNLRGNPGSDHTQAAGHHQHGRTHHVVILCMTNNLLAANSKAGAVGEVSCGRAG